MSLSPTSILTCFLCHVASDHPIDRHGEHIVIDGHSLSIPALVAVARHNAQIVLDDSPEIRAGIQKSRDVIVGKVETSQKRIWRQHWFRRQRYALSAGVLTPTCDSSARLFEADTVLPTLWPSEVHYCNTNIRVSCHHPQMSSLLFLFSTHSHPRACQSLGFVEQSLSALIP